MAATRKLLAEITQTLKKVEEGVLLFDDIWEKVYAASPQALKEKYEGDLKKEIKKLQRLRDQIKTWIGSNEVKDKSNLMEARKTIETKMEQFKVCEKDTKTKAFSKEGLARQAILDPLEVAKEEKRSWINECLDQLNDVINSIEAEKEKLSSAKGNKTKNKELQVFLENRTEKSKWHIDRLEHILKLMDNDGLDPSLLDSIKDSLDYYVESAADDDGAVGIEDEYDLYEDLGIDFESGFEIGVIRASSVNTSISGEPGIPTTLPTDGVPISKDIDTSTTPIPAPVKAPVAPVAPVSAIQSIGTTVRPSPVKTPSTVASIAAKTPSIPLATKIMKGPNSTPQSPIATNPSGDASNPPSLKADRELSSDRTESTMPAPVSWAHAASVPSQSAASILKASSAPTPQSPQLSAASILAATPLSTVSASTTPASSNASQTSQSSRLNTVVAVSSPALASAFPTIVSEASAGSKPPMSLSSAVSASAVVTGAPSAPAQTVGTSALTAAALIAGGGGDAVGGITSNSSSQQPPPLQQKVNSCASSVVSPDLMAASNMLKLSMINLPEGIDLDKPASSYAPKNFYGQTHSSYPSTPLYPTPTSSLSSSTVTGDTNGAGNNQAVLFDKLPMDSLFFAFYFQQGTYQQHLAAKQLKKHSWRFHKKYMTWFQRHEEPKIANEEYEDGTYVYFDYESGWCQRIKSEFKFEYAYLEG
jgi:CCR4-NOT transcription complex subunit 3